MLQLSHFKNVLVSYVRKPDTLIAKVDFHKLFGPNAVLEVQKGAKKGVIVAIGPDILGWSLCNSSPSGSDVFNKSKGIDIALRRAIYAEKLSFLEREEFYDKVPLSMEKEFATMRERSEKYFQYEEEVDDLPF